MTDHNPVRVTWACTGCGLPWPCAVRRGQFFAEYEGAPTALTVLMTAGFLEAVHDMPDESAGALYDRFISWLNRKDRR